MTSAALPKASGPRHLLPEEIFYLAFEGGGGKGLAFLGALQVLEERGVLKQVKGVSGSSAGAITALMVSLGLTTKEIEEQITNKVAKEQITKPVDFNSFFDLPHPRLIPQVCPSTSCDYEPRDNNGPEESLLVAYLDPKTVKDVIHSMKQGDNFLDAYQSLIFSSLTKGMDTEAILSSWIEGIDPPLSTLAAYWAPYLVYLNRDMGFFSGRAMRLYLDELISKRAAKLEGGKPADYANMSFERHKKIFKRELLVCGANFSTGKTELFSARPEHTQYFPVADAIRISAGVPIAFKPYVIKKKIPGWPPCGTYVDGGYWNNLPLREIEPQAAPAPQKSPTSAILATATQERHVLALRLGIDEPQVVENIYDIALRMIEGLQGSGESQVLREFKHLTVSLDTRDLSLFKFTVDEPIRKKVTKRSRRRMREYFGDIILPKDEDYDKEDDLKTKNLDKLTACE